MGGCTVKALVIGAAGFVGDYLVSRVLSSMHCDVVATKLPHEKLDRADIEVRDLDILDADGVASLLAESRPAYLFHLAAQSSVPLSWEKPHATVEANIIGSLNILTALRGVLSPPRTLIVGSGEEYGPANGDRIPIREDARLWPQNVYAVTKACQNMMATVYSRAYQLPLVMVRAFNHIGPGQSPAFVVSDFCRQVAEIERGRRAPVMEVGNLDARRDFTDVRDVVRAYTGIIQRGRPGETYNVGSGTATSIAEMLDMILARSTCEITVCVNPEKLRPVEVPVIAADVHKVYDAIGWNAEIPLAQSISDTLEYWRGLS